MRIQAQEERLFVISDLHLGNPNSTARSRLGAFIDYARARRASVCINGDGFDLAQTSFPRLAGDSLPVISSLRRLLDADLRVYYVVGNHDMVLEHFLSDLVFSRISPFLNLRSGTKLIRIEHGHLYDPWFSRAPVSYQWATRLAGYALVAVPDVYKLWAQVGSAVDRAQSWRVRRSGSEVSSIDRYHEAAQTILERGFDAVIFGHTHDSEQIELPDGVYVNSGNWLRGNTYVEIDAGRVELRSWDQVAQNT